ncbi:MAG: YitT family protein [Anaerolineales bacterium]|nr:YitT family protein [Anaerolineales bacterium]
MSQINVIKSRRFKFRSNWKNFILLTIGGVILAVNVNLFLAPANLAPGGVSGLAIIINELTSWPIGLTMLVLNIPLLVLGFFYLGRFNFLIHTLFVVLIYNLGVDIVAGWLPAGGITDDLLLNTIYGGVMGGIGTGLVFRANGTSGGTGVLARVIQLRTGIPISQVFLITDGGVVFLAGLLFGWEIGLYSLITLFIWGVVVDYVLEGPSVVRTAFIITDRPQEVAHAVMSRLSLGVTSWPAQGMFTEASRTLLFCTVSRGDANTLQATILAEDQNAFVVIGHGHQAVGGVIGHSGNVAPLATSEPDQEDSK